MPRGQPMRNYPPPAKEIARCAKCGRVFVWLPPRFDMIHRYGDGQFCGGKIEMLPNPLPEREVAP